MSQIKRLKSRLKNVGKTTTEYRMTVIEARELLEEITTLEKSLEEKPKTVIEKEANIETAPMTRIIDGGTF